MATPQHPVTAAGKSPASGGISMLACQLTMETSGGSHVLDTPIRHNTPPIHSASTEYIAAPRVRSSQTGWKRHGHYGAFTFSASSDSGHLQDHAGRSATPELLSIPRNFSRPSTSSGLDDSPRRGRSTPDADARSETSNARSSVFCWHSEDFEILIEELTEDDPRFLRSSGLLKPDKVSEAGSEAAASPSRKVQDDIIKRIEELYCDEEEEKNEAIRKWEARRSRYSARSKRTWSQSQRSDFDFDVSASVDFDEAEASAHRTKKRRSELAQRSSLIFDDPPRYNIAEVDENEDEAVLIDAPPPYAEVDWSDLGLRSLPFCILPDSESDFSSSDEDDEE